MSIPIELAPLLSLPIQPPLARPGAGVATQLAGKVAVRVNRSAAFQARARRQRGAALRPLVFIPIVAPLLSLAIGAGPALALPLCRQLAPAATELLARRRVDQDGITIGAPRVLRPGGDDPRALAEIPTSRLAIGVIRGARHEATIADRAFSRAHPTVDVEIAIPARGRPDRVPDPAPRDQDKRRPISPPPFRALSAKRLANQVAAGRLV
jgi:hypothetical protein